MLECIAMPIERRTYHPENDPKNIIYNFLKSNPEYAYTPEEIAFETALPIEIVNIDLLFLASYQEVQSVWGENGMVHYQISDKK